MNWLYNKIESFKDKNSFVIGGKYYTYSDLLDEINAWSDAVDLCSIPNKAAIVVEGDFSIELISLILALKLNNNIIIPLTSELAIKKDKYINIAKPDYIIDLNNDKQGFAKINQSTTHDLYEKLYSQNKSGLVLFSSGTTGDPKAIVVDFDELIEKHKNVSKQTVLMSFLKHDHIGGINTIIYSICTGSCAVYPDNRSSENVLDHIEKYKVEILPVTPTFINMMLHYVSANNYKLDSLKLITYGTEPMPQKTLDKLCKQLPQVKLKQTYGLSEVGIISTKSKSNNELWLKISDDVKYKIVNDILWIKSKTSMLGYLNAKDEFDNDGYFNTNDHVMEQDGYIKILGRKSEIINVGGEKVYPSEIEGILNEVDGVIDVSVIAEKNPITGMAIRAKVRHSKNINTLKLKEYLLKKAKSDLQPFKRPMLYEFTTDEIHNDRFKKLRKW